jgi:hypothetical protein
MADYRFYKYSKINNHFLKALEEGTIYFSRQKDLNDPFDCELDIEKAIKNAATAISDGKAKKLRDLLKTSGEFERFQANVDKLGIFSSSGAMDEFQTLLWAHYADNHKGVCVLYEMPMEFLDDEDNILAVSKVAYGQDTLTEWFKALAKKLPVSHKYLITELLKVVLTAKSPPWQYEGEVRIIRPSSGSFEIDKSFLKQICFGLQSSDKEIEKVKSAIKGYKTKIDLYRAIRGGTDFGIEYTEI